MPEASKTAEDQLNNLSTTGLKRYVPMKCTIQLATHQSLNGLGAVDIIQIQIAVGLIFIEGKSVIGANIR